MKKPKIVKFLVVILSLVIILATVFFIGLSIKSKEFSNQVNSIDLKGIELSSIENGNYEGSYNLNEFVGAKVSVKIEDKKIKNIIILDHKYGKGQAAEQIITDVIDAQSTNVDVISGATGSSKVLLKAVENALS